MSVLEERSPARLAAPSLKLGELVKTVPTLHATDSLAKALRLFGQSGLPALPVVEGELLVGLLTERDLQGWIAEKSGALALLPPEAAHDAMVMQLMRRELTVGLTNDSLDEVLGLFEHEGYKLLPVLDAGRRFRGVLTRQTVLSALTRQLRPATIGGMATPLGVYLTTGSLSAGAGFWGLFLSGALMSLVARAIDHGVEQLEPVIGTPLRDSFASLIALFCFLCLLRLSPLAGFHAAEHQTVNAIERGETLEPEDVMAMPREHPRCGTNLMALLFGAEVLLPLAHDPLWLLPGAAALFLGWRTVGTWMQRVFTTKRPRRYQLLSGIRAGQALLDAYALNPSYRAGRWRRLWNMGLIQVVLGGLVPVAALELAAYLLPNLRGILQ